MDMTARLALPLLTPGQAQKELFHNEALQVLDSLVAAAVDDGPVNDPPANPIAGQGFLVGSQPTGAWDGFADHVAAYSEGGWRFIPPTAGMSVFIKAKNLVAAFVGTGWEIGSVRASRVLVDGVQIVGGRAAPIANPSGGAAIDAESRAAIVSILDTLRQHGLIYE